MIGYCLKCGKHVDIVNVKNVLLGRSLPVKQGSCALCGNRINDVAKMKTTETVMVFKKQVKKDSHIHVPGLIRKDQLSLRTKNRKKK